MTSLLVDRPAASPELESVQRELLHDALNRLRSNDGVPISATEAALAIKNTLFFLGRASVLEITVSPSKEMDPVFHCVALNPLWLRFLRTTKTPFIAHQPTGKGGNVDGYSSIRAQAMLELGADFVSSLWPNIASGQSGQADCVISVSGQADCISTVSGQADCISTVSGQADCISTVSGHDNQAYLLNEFGWEPGSHAVRLNEIAAEHGLPGTFDLTTVEDIEMLSAIALINRNAEETFTITVP